MGYLTGFPVRQRRYWTRLFGRKNDEWFINRDPEPGQFGDPILPGDRRGGRIVNRDIFHGEAALGPLVIPPNPGPSGFALHYDCDAVQRLMPGMKHVTGHSPVPSP